ncbi:hypothetical protein B4Q04_20310 [Zobellia sp. OII3]|uniref:helix-turn-helix domain-containing protein n=1 Tax=Zobellia sp. OII3 TaxID=2034520 RepID=UPI000B536FB1|nr:helix-turn-helix domain-containing protein [Zobellia sp. OII3]OWW23542.1 hypothetical protein B4Q04_20310 [Zobellia sp. OII3]
MGKKQRIERIKRMLLEMASGNFFYRLERSFKNDALEAIAVSLNMLAEEVSEAMLHQGYANSNTTIMETIQMSFIVDSKGYIKMVNQQACNILSVLKEDIIGNKFSVFLEDKSKVRWSEVRDAMPKREFQETSIKLSFRKKGGLAIPKLAHATLFFEKNREQNMLITVIHHSYGRDALENDLKRNVIEHKEKQGTGEHRSKKPKIRLSFDDIRKLRKGHDLLMNNLETHFPPLKDFALQIGTNEFKLKYGFKELYGTTVHRFLMEERLRKSKMMIRYTDKPLKSIANLTGFKSLAHFSRTFKKRYGYTPSDLRRKSFSEE